MSWFRRALNQEPAMMLSAIVGIAALGIPAVVVPARRALGLDTYQWDADPRTHPYINMFGQNYRRYKFDDAALIAEWSQHQPYHYLGDVTPKPLDYPAARERIAARSAQ